VAGVGINEIGRVTLTYRLEMEALEDLIYEDNRALEKDYFDPFVKDRSQISKVLLTHYRISFLIESQTHRGDAETQRR
jgi:hypothetical protein